MILQQWVDYSSMRERPCRSDWKLGTDFESSFRQRKLQADGWYNGYGLDVAFSFNDIAAADLHSVSNISWPCRLCSLQVWLFHSSDSDLVQPEGRWREFSLQPIAIYGYLLGKGGMIVFVWLGTFWDKSSYGVSISYHPESSSIISLFSRVVAQALCHSLMRLGEVWFL